LAKKLGKNPRELAAEIIAQVNLEDLCETPEIAGPGFINLRLKDSWLAAQVTEAIHDERVGVPRVDKARTYVVDYSSPNVAKPMHVGHIRSTVIGDSLARTLKFLGHTVITDNHLGDWGTQFGMIIYGYKHFVDQAAYEQAPVAELSRLYRMVRGLMDYHEAVKNLPKVRQKLTEAIAEQQLLESQPPIADKAEQKKRAKELRRLEGQIRELTSQVTATEAKIRGTKEDPAQAERASQHEKISSAVLDETAKLHEGDPTNKALWEEFLPKCRVEIEKVYQRLGVTFDYQLGESFYHDMLAPVVEEFATQGLSKESEGATCLFLKGFAAPMIIRKRDGAFLYSTTDLATIRYRMEEWRPDAILYVVDFRQGDHFDKLFAAAKLWGYTDLELKHVSFGTVMGEDGKPFKTRDGDTIGLEGLLDEAVEKAYQVVESNARTAEGEQAMPEDELRRIAGTVGIAALKYGDLSQNRESDYKFSYEKMLALNGNTATYLQYAYARVQSIFRRGEIEIANLRASGGTIDLEHPAERALAVAILRFTEALDDVVADYRPNLLTNYLFDELAKSYSTFFDQCHVLKADNDQQRNSRLLLCDLTARVIRQGLDLLGIETVDKM
ncbi:MAG: arginine--tRNA ligase, partial [Pirellulaceae bacterium]